MATSPRNHCRIISIKKLKLEIFGFLIKKSFFDVDGPFLCLQNSENSSPKKKHSTTSLIFIFQKIG